MLLSICIPTYNHAGFLDQMLAQLTGLPSFADEIEVVISDNASTDETPQIAARYVERFPERVKYARNPENVFDANFALALSRGTGQFLKLANDTLLFTDEGLKEMLDTIRRERRDRPVLFFLNGEGGVRRSVTCRSMDELWRAISFHSTWIGSFGIWKDDFDRLPDFDRAGPLQLIQVDVLCRMMSRKRQAVVSPVRFATSIPRDSIGGYNLAKVFGRNYFSILKEYVVDGLLSARTFRSEKYRMLRHHILPFYLSLSRKFRFPKSGYIQYLLKDCWTIPLYWLSLPFVCAVRFLGLFRRVK